jgi:transposase
VFTVLQVIEVNFSKHLSLSDNSFMDKDEYIKQLEEENAALKKRIKMLGRRIEELERLLGMNSTNSSKPPSSDPPGMSVILPRRRRKKRGARNGHQPHLRKLLPPNMVKQRFELKPQVCICGSTNLEETSEEPSRHQIVDIPPIEPKVTEYVQHIFRCKDCGELIYQPLPDEVKRRYFGPGILAVVAVLTGMLNTSKRKALAMIDEVFSVPMSLGGLSNCKAQLADALGQPYQETMERVRQQQVAHADETGWRQGNRQRGWLWALCCARAAVFMVHAQRGQKAARKLLGTFCGTLVSDRWGGYNFFGGARQICWAHLKRDFKAISQAKGSPGKTGQQLHGLAKKILKMRRRVRDGTLQWWTFQKRMKPLMNRVERLLEEGARGQGKLKVRGLFKTMIYVYSMAVSINFGRVWRYRAENSDLFAPSHSIWGFWVRLPGEHTGIGLGQVIIGPKISHFGCTGRYLARAA